MITELPSHRDVIPRGLTLAVGNLALQEPWALGHGISASTPCGREAITVLTEPGLSALFSSISETPGTLREVAE